MGFHWIVDEGRIYSSVDFQINSRSKERLNGVETVEEGLVNEMKAKQEWTFPELGHAHLIANLSQNYGATQ